MIKRVLIFSAYYTPHIGGVEKHILEINKRLLHSGQYKLTVVTGKHESSLKEKEIVKDVEVFRFSYPNIKYIGLLFIWLKMLRYLMLIRRADIVHIHDVFIWYLPFRFLFPAKKVCTTFHGYESFPIKKVAILQKRIACLLSWKTLAVGRYIEKWYGISVNKIIYGAVDSRVFQPQKKHPVYDAVILGRLTSQTGVDVYLKAIKKLHKLGYKFEILVLGEGELEKYFQKVTTVLGFRTRISQYLEESKYVFACGYLSLLEAFACKKPAFVVVNNPLREDYICMTPFAQWVISVNSPKELICAIMHLKGERKRQIKKQINAAYEWSKLQTWQALANVYKDLWQI